MWRLRTVWLQMGDGGTPALERCNATECEFSGGGAFEGKLGSARRNRLCSAVTPVRHVCRRWREMALRCGVEPWSLGVRVTRLVDLAPLDTFT